MGIHSQRHTQTGTQKHKGRGVLTKVRGQSQETTCKEERRTAARCAPQIVIIIFSFCEHVRVCKCVSLAAYKVLVGGVLTHLP